MMKKWVLTLRNYLVSKFEQADENTTWDRTLGVYGD